MRGVDEEPDEIATRSIQPYEQEECPLANKAKQLLDEANLRVIKQNENNKKLHAAYENLIYEYKKEIRQLKDQIQDMSTTASYPITSGLYGKEFYR